LNYAIAAPSWLAPAVIAGLIGAFVALKSILADKRNRALIDTAQQLGLKFEGENWAPGSQAPQLETPLFEHRTDEQIRNIMSGTREGLAVSFFDYWYGRGKGHREQTLAAFSQQVWLPSFELGPRSIIRGMGIHFESHPDFAKRFRLSSVDPEKTRELFTPGMLSFLESFDLNSKWRLEGSGLTLVVYRSGKKVGPQEFLSFVEETTRIAKTFFHLSGLKEPGHRPSVLGLIPDKS
jgi:hypothetical protein